MYLFDIHEVCMSNCDPSKYTYSCRTTLYKVLRIHTNSHLQGLY